MSATLCHQAEVAARSTTLCAPMHVYWTNALRHKARLSTCAEPLVAVPKQALLLLQTSYYGFEC